MTLISTRVDLLPIFKVAREMAGQKLITKHLKKSQTELLREVKKRSPVKTGKYKQSWKKGKITRQSAHVETPKKKLYKLLEFTGAKPHIIRARNAQFLHWVDEDTGKDMFRKMVNHPGFRPIPHARPAARAVSLKTAKAVIKDAEEIMRGKMVP